MEIDAARMLLASRWAALATLNDDGPAASMVAYVPEPDLSSVLLFLSGLAEHTRDLLAEPRVSLVISEADSGSGDPQTLARFTVRGIAEKIERNAPDFDDAWLRYLERFPDAAPRLALADFSLFRVTVVEGRYIGGFAQAGTIPFGRLAAAASEL